MLLNRVQHMQPPKPDCPEFIRRGVTDFFLFLKRHQITMSQNVVSVLTLCAAIPSHLAPPPPYPHPLEEAGSAGLVFQVGFVGGSEGGSKECQQIPLPVLVNMGLATVPGLEDARPLNQVSMPIPLGMWNSGILCVQALAPLLVTYPYRCSNRRFWLFKSYSTHLAAMANQMATIRDNRVPPIPRWLHPHNHKPQPNI